MTRQIKVVQCPHCQEYTYLPMGFRPHCCSQCRTKFAPLALAGVNATSARGAQFSKQNIKCELHEIEPPQCTKLRRSPTADVLNLLRQSRTTSVPWIPITKIIDHCVANGLSPKKVHTAIIVLIDEGFLEMREGFIRAIPIF